QYVASIAPIALVCGAVGLAAHRWRVVVVPAALMVGVLSWLTWQHVHVYHDSESLWRDTLTKNPDSWIAHTNLAQTLILPENTRAEGLEHFERAYELAPNRAETIWRAGQVRAERKQYVEAIGFFDRAIGLEPEFAEPYYSKGLALEELN